MNYTRKDAKHYAKANMTGVWAAVTTAMNADKSINWKGVENNLIHYAEDLGIDGVFMGGKQAEFYALSLEERKKLFEVAVNTLKGKAGVITSCSDQNSDTVIELAKFSEKIGADYIVVHAPLLHFTTKQDETLYHYYKTISENTSLGIAMWSHPDSNYLMTPETCEKIANLPNIVAIKYSVPRDMYVDLTKRVGSKIHVSTASEDEWFENMHELNWQLYLCSNTPFIIQTKNDKRMREYTDLAFKGEWAKAKVIRDSLNPVRHAFKSTKPAEKPHAHAKYWQELLGQAGGGVRSPMLDLTEAEKRVIKLAFETSGLKL
jgi:4-hydroxy-tetrahydrodipicolinate synthase